jgi:hypothetical protein
VEEEHLRPAIFELEELRRTERAFRDRVVIAEHELISPVLKDTFGDLWIMIERREELVPRLARPLAFQRFEDISEQDDPIDVFLQVLQEPEKLRLRIFLLAPEAIEVISPSQVKVAHYGNLHRGFEARR